MDLSVVIPTRDRRDRVERTLAALDRQDLEGASAELIVVDNGSADGTPAALAGRDASLPTRVLSQPRPGASAARNVGLQCAAGSIVLLLGDDTSPASNGLLAGHLALHRCQPDPRYAVLGRISWAPQHQADPFLQWLDDAGFQFSFDRLAPGIVATADHFYSSHVSARRSTLLEVGGFDESFPFLAEDTELGIRLERAGVRLDYHPELLVHHDHPQDVAEFAHRMELVGQAACLLHQRWPDRTPAAVSRPAPRWIAYPFAAAAGRALLRTPVRGLLRKRAWAAVLMAAYAKGYRRGPPASVATG